MMYYVAHKYGGSMRNWRKAAKITHDLQVKDIANCYICPLIAFSHLGYREIEFENELELCFDILQNCDKLIVASDVSDGVRAEIEFAKLIKLEVVSLGENGELQPFEE